MKLFNRYVQRNAKQTSADKGTGSTKFRTCASKTNQEMFKVSENNQSMLKAYLQRH